MSFIHRCAQRFCYSNKKDPPYGGLLPHARQEQQFMFSCQNGITIHRQPSTSIIIYTFHTSMSPAIYYSKKISVRNGLAHARRRQQFMCSCQNGMIIHRQPSTNIFNIYFSYLDVPCDLLFKTTKKVSVRNVLAHARQRQQFIFSCQNGITIHRQPSTNIKIYTFHTSMSPAICYSNKNLKKSPYGTDWRTRVNNNNLCFPAKTG
jgi:hypothetical protein